MLLMNRHNKTWFHLQYNVTIPNLVKQNFFSIAKPHKFERKKVVAGSQPATSSPSLAILTDALEECRVGIAFPVEVALSAAKIKSVFLVLAFLVTMHRQEILVVSVVCSLLSKNPSFQNIVLII